MTSDAGGAYAFAGLAAGGSYTVTPAKAQYLFTPSSRTVSGLASNQVLNFVATAAPEPVTSLYPAALSFAATAGGGAVTPPQTVTVSLGGTAAGWNATSNQGWLKVTSGSGNGAGQFTVSISTAALPGVGTASGKVTVSVPSARCDGGFGLRADGERRATTSAPRGAFDTPADGAAVASSIPVTGWALDDVGVTGVQIWRDQGGLGRRLEGRFTLATRCLCRGRGRTSRRRTRRGRYAIGPAGAT